MIYGSVETCQYHSFVIFFCTSALFIFVRHWVRDNVMDRFNKESKGSAHSINCRWWHFFTGFDKFLGNLPSTSKFLVFFIVYVIQCLTNCLLFGEKDKTLKKMADKQKKMNKYCCKQGSNLSIIKKT